jgi:hypothetical protein
MKALTIILVVVLLLLAGGGTWWYLTNRTTNDNSNATNNASLANNAAAVPRESGALVVEREAQFGGLPLRLTTASLEPNFHGSTAAEGKTYVVLFLAPFSGNDSAANLQSRLSTGVRLTAAGDRSYAVRETKVVTASAENAGDQGYLWFEVDADATGFTLVFGEGDEAVTVPLSF